MIRGAHPRRRAGQGPVPQLPSHALRRQRRHGTRHAGGAEDLLRRAQDVRGHLAHIPSRPTRHDHATTRGLWHAVETAGFHIRAVRCPAPARPGGRARLSLPTAGRTASLDLRIYTSELCRHTLDTSSTHWTYARQVLSYLADSVSEVQVLRPASTLTCAHGQTPATQSRTTVGVHRASSSRWVPTRSTGRRSRRPTSPHRRARPSSATSSRQRSSLTSTAPASASRPPDTASCRQHVRP
jgi:hypothetical protein